ncbi:helix-turn-helix domain-containing protein [Veillonella agrestimuris]|uniref:helix-turn-helix domain-containing protein n=1 Tax=Veillonella agrestimuris TaxID=2941340 RepID=UPI002041AE43|nr:helix-turn-helix transcriptional regulator [Veillonella agrestimuris]
MAELGEELRRERVRRNLTFKDIEQVLHIKTKYLEAIEDGNFNHIPGNVYAKGFIRNYGNYLGLDGDRLVKEYQHSIGEVDTFTVRPVMRQKSESTVGDVQSEYVEHQMAKKRMSLETRQVKRQRSIVQERIILTIILILMGLFLIWLFFL